ncbi:DNA-repair protein XRCC1 [Vigna radiata var. radiata]|uniref:DNA-repair protein XRCC1 n=1 Tax=Vigna radiata var. radiata TaxID=3916 RepID=A0A1S3U681_VIGRR|nr:DNA-repair protein XRCC1 [Vigna radiata var. radiata]XP_014501507.1 DNA-repair protein XRCC1 [Vigna radiata var. radiata]XP_022637130.1 DNA-repair protein XRCC1 [Vigna radiata var. radiata]
MSGAKRSANDSGSKRSLPSWTCSKENKGENREKKPTFDGKGEKSNEGETPRMGKVQNENVGKSSASSLEFKSFNKLLEGVVFVLSGFVNPERGMLRSRAMEMGAQYQPDWNSDCTLLVCAFPNTPKFRQVEADCGTIVSKDWIIDCYTQRKLIEIDSYLLHAGKPWRKGNVSGEVNEDKIPSVPKKSPKHVDGEQSSKSTASIKSKGKCTDISRKCFEPSEVKEWAIHDLNKTIQWLESQEEKPDPSEVTKIAAEGILTCLQDAIRSLEEKQDIRKGTEDWMFLPRVVEELAKLDVVGNKKTLLSKEDLHRQALDCKRIYEEELSSLDHQSKKNSKVNKEQTSKTGRTNAMSSDAVEYDSDDTIEMTEQEIDLAYKTLSSNIGHL